MSQIFFVFYFLLSLVIYAISLPFVLVLSIFNKKYKKSLPARFLLYNNPALMPDGIWFHVCSLGEAKSIKPIVDRVPNELLRMSATTSTGVDALKEYTTQSRYLPFEPLLMWWIKPQRVLVVMEAEFWYLLFALSKRRGAKTILVNARMSDKSFGKYRRFSWVYKQIFKYIDEVYAQTKLDAERLGLLGAKNITVAGNIKLSMPSEVTAQLKKPDALLVCAASTHEGEEEIILEAFAKLKRSALDAVLVLAPRHPERFETVAMQIENFASNKGFSWHRYSDEGEFNSDIVLIDALGELVNIYAISDIVILGGAFAPIGGHNAAEPAQFGCKIITGKHYHNQREIFDSIENIKIVESAELGDALLQHHLLEPTKIKRDSNIDAIIKSILE